MNYIDESQLGAVLSALEEQLRASDAVAHLVVIGGSGLLAIGAVDRATQDVDVVAVVRGGALDTAEPLPAAVSRAADIVARDFALPRGWLNAGPTSLLEISGLPTGFEERVVRRVYGPALTIDFAGRLDQIHLKLYAYSDRREPRDLTDLRGLGPSPAELHAAARWARTHNAPGPFDELIARALTELGVDDVGRQD